VLHVEYAERGKEYGILFIFSLFYEYIPLEYVRIPVVYRVHQAEYGIHIRVAVSQEYVNTNSTPRTRVGKNRVNRSSEPLSLTDRVLASSPPPPALSLVDVPGVGLTLNPDTTGLGKLPGTILSSIARVGKKEGGFSAAEPHGQGARLAFTRYFFTLKVLCSY